MTTLSQCQRAYDNKDPVSSEDWTDYYRVKIETHFISRFAEVKSAKTGNAYVMLHSKANRRFNGNPDTLDLRR